MKKINTLSSVLVLGSAALFSGCTTITNPNPGPASITNVMPATPAPVVAAPAPAPCAAATEKSVDGKTQVKAGKDGAQTPRDVRFQAQRLTAIGYGALVRDNGQSNFAQQKLMAMRAAQVDAYRNLTEQVYGFRLWGTTSISAYAAQNDSVRSYVEGFIRGARVVNATQGNDGIYEVTVELELTTAFFGQFVPPQDMTQPTTSSPCAQQSAASQPGLAAVPLSTMPLLPPAPLAMAPSNTSCSSIGCVQSSSYYYSK